MNPLSRNCFRFAAVISFVGFLFFFFLFPTTVFQAFLVKQGLSLQRYYGLGLYATLFGMGVFWLLHHVFSNADKQSYGYVLHEKKERSGGYLPAVKIGLSVLILAMSFSQIRGPLEYDETSVSTLFQSGNLWEIANPFRSAKNHTQNTNQSIATVLSYASVSMFGMNKVALRLPACIAAIVAMILLYFLTKEFSTLSQILLYLHLAVNQLLIWYLHVSKGYVYLFVFSLLLFSSILRPGRRRALWYGIAFAGAALSHTFGALFCIVFFLSLLFWMTLRQSALEPLVAAYYRRCLWISLALVPLLLVVLIAHFLSMEQRAELYHVKSYATWETWGGLIGLTKIWWSKAVLIFAVALAIYLWRGKKEWSFLSIFILSSFVFFQITSWVLGSFSPYPRLMLAFLVPFVLWLCESVDRDVPARWVWGSALSLLLLIAPFSLKKEVFDSIVLIYVPFDQFMEKSLAKAPDSAGTCFRFHGEGTEREFAEKVYFADRLKRSNLSKCLNTYHVVLFDKPSFRDSVKEILNDKKGRSLYLFSNIGN